MLRGTGNLTYLLAPLGSPDPYWGDHLARQPQVKAKIMRVASDLVPADMELLRRWRVVSEPGQAPNPEDYGSLPQHITETILPKWRFLHELVVAEKPQPQAGNDPPGR